MTARTIVIPRETMIRAYEGALTAYALYLRRNHGNTDPATVKLLAQAVVTVTGEMGAMGYEFDEETSTQKADALACDLVHGAGAAL